MDWIKHNNRTTGVLAAVILGGAVLRFIRIDAQSLWFDEAISYLTASLPVGDIMTNGIQDPHPPLYYLLLHFWLPWLPNNDFAARLLSALLGIGLIPAVYLLALEIFQSRELALFPAFLTAVSPFQILYSQELRMYTLVMLLCALLVLTYLRAWRTEGWRWWVLTAVFGILALYTHLFAAFVLAATWAHAAIQVIREKKYRSQFWRTTGVGVVTGIFFLPWVRILLWNSTADIGTLRPLLQDSQIEKNPLKLISTTAFLLFGQSFITWYVATILFLIISTCIIFLMVLARRHKLPRNPGLLLVGLAALFPILFPVTVYTIRPFFLPERTMAVASPMLFILMAWGLKQRRTPLPLLMILSAVVMLIGTGMYLAGEEFKPPYGEAIAFVAERRQAGDVVLHTSDGSYLPSLRYVDLPDHFLLAGDPDLRKPEPVYPLLGAEIVSLDEAVKDGRRLWLVVALEHSEEWQKDRVNQIQNRFNELESHEFDGIFVLLFDLN